MKILLILCTYYLKCVIFVLLSATKLILNFNGMKEFFLKVNNNGSLNGSYLSVWENDTEKVLIRCIKEATKNGWTSAKNIFEDLDVIKKESDNDFINTEECANKLLAKYGNVTTKIYTSPDYVPFSSAHAIANFITKNGTDPYDRG